MTGKLSKVNGKTEDRSHHGIFEHYYSSRTTQPCRWRNYDPQKYQELLTQWHVQKTWVFSSTTVRTLGLTLLMQTANYINLLNLYKICHRSGGCSVFVMTCLWQSVLHTDLKNSPLVHRHTVPFGWFQRKTVLNSTLASTDKHGLAILGGTVKHGLTVTGLRHYHDIQGGPTICRWFLNFQP